MHACTQTRTHTCTDTHSKSDKNCKKRKTIKISKILKEVKYHFLSSCLFYLMWPQNFLNNKTNNLQLHGQEVGISAAREHCPRAHVCHVSRGYRWSTGTHLCQSSTTPRPACCVETQDLWFRTWSSEWCILTNITKLLFGYRSDDYYQCNYSLIIWLIVV